MKIADFGFCCHVSNEQEMQRRCGSDGYAAPEIILRQTYGPNVDCFSAGVLLYFLVSGKLPFHGPDFESRLKKLISSPLNFRKSVRLECLSESCKDFMVELTTRDPSQRPTSKNALKSLWLSRGPERRESVWSDPGIGAMASARDSPKKHTSTLTDSTVLTPVCPQKADMSGSFHETADNIRMDRHRRKTYHPDGATAASLKEVRSDKDYTDVDLKFLREPKVPECRPVKGREPCFLQARRRTLDKLLMLR
jgi:serine/threonine protein kinase